MNEFENKVVLITGAGGWPGRALLRAFAAQGAVLAANDLTDISLEAVVAEIKAEGGEIQTFIGDISKKLALQTIVADVLEAYQRIDILVNHASVQPHFSILAMDEWDWRRTLEVNLTGTFLMTQTVGRVMRELGGGAILNIGPCDAQNMDQPRAAYLAAKEGVKAFTKAAAHELGEYNIRVNAVCPSKANREETVSQALALCQGRASGEVLTIGM